MKHTIIAMLCGSPRNAMYYNGIGSNGFLNDTINEKEPELLFDTYEEAEKEVLFLSKNERLDAYEFGVFSFIQK